MPLKPSTIIPMQSYTAFNSRRWYAASVESVARPVTPGKLLIQIVLSILNDPRQAGRKITHDRPALLAPSSPLHEFLANGFGVRPTANEQVDLTTLVGQTVDLRFTSMRDSGQQHISSVRYAQLLKRVRTSRPQESDEDNYRLG